MKIYKYLFFFTLLLPICTHAQTGPGGVGDSTSNVLWLKADTGTSTNINGQPINMWDDISGNENHISQATIAQQPLFQSNIFNGQPAVAFDFNNSADQNDYLSAPDSPNLDSTGGLTIFAVVRPTSSGSARSIIAKRVNVGVDQSYMLFFFTSDQLFADIVSNNNRFSTPTSFSSGNDFIITMHFDGSLPSASRSKIFSNESLIVTSAETDSFIPDFNSPLIIGSTHIGDNRAFGGYMGEIIVYREALNSSQRIIINNYLSAKYNIPLTTNDIYTMDNTLNGDFDYEVAGIGRVSPTDLHVNAKGSGIVNILNPQNLEDNEFLLWGHNNLPQQAFDSTDVPPSIDARFERVWRVSEVNSTNNPVNVGNIDIRWDLSNYSPVTASDLRLLIDTDNDGSFSDETPIGGATMISSGIYQFSDVSAITNSRRFSLGTINSLQTPLPIELLSFTLTQVDAKKVSIEWVTSSEINNEYFEVQRSTDLLNWKIISTVKGAGNSNALIKYSAIDQPSIEGILYYKLKQIDFNGEYEYSKIKSISIEKERAFPEMEICPNPAKDFINVVVNNSYKKIANDEIRVYNLLGKDVTSMVTVDSITDNKFAVNISMLIKGNYLIKTKSSSIMFSKK